MVFIVGVDRWVFACTGLLGIASLFICLVDILAAGSVLQDGSYIGGGALESITGAQSTMVIHVEQ
jgi:hypothetical protein